MKSRDTPPIGSRCGCSPENAIVYGLTRRAFSISAATVSWTALQVFPRKVVSLLYRDYKTFKGLKMPSIIETSGDAHSPPDRMVIERVLLNQPLDSWAFVNPATPRSRPRGLPLPAMANPATQASAPVRPSDSTVVGGERSGPAPE